ncbi:MAG: XRE family transcriptional regulator [Mesorhizobium sp.]|uniref:hypothetical protein n=1 Tax=Mesorhizobium sp. TaxID=1871066 RepID=UPI000FE4CAAA|nr:hypothetical protein [Mesorhizobium sp.]RWB08731.1 MAG: XRE family transcriptional regulator [Mesorhizobium sp.]RWB13616.1 MAG: XRE family transcriptional regulator [Mesorhizobium sp.]
MADNLEWHDKVIFDLENSDLSYAELARKYGRSRDTIIKLARLHNVLRRVPIAKGARRAVDMKELSPQHKALGTRLTIFRENRNYSEAAAIIGVSRHVLKYMELGCYDFTLTQLNRISELLGASFVEMTTGFRMSTPRGGPTVRHD